MASSNFTATSCLLYTYTRDYCPHIWLSRCACASAAPFHSSASQLQPHQRWAYTETWKWELDVQDTSMCLSISMCLTIGTVTSAGGDSAKIISGVSWSRGSLSAQGHLGIWVPDGSWLMSTGSEHRQSSSCLPASNPLSTSRYIVQSDTGSHGRNPALIINFQKTLSFWKKKTTLKRWISRRTVCARSSSLLLGIHMFSGLWIHMVVKPITLYLYTALYFPHPFYP